MRSATKTGIAQTNLGSEQGVSDQTYTKIGMGQIEIALATLGQTKQCLATIDKNEQYLTKHLARQN